MSMKEFTTRFLKWVGRAYLAFPILYPLLLATAFNVPTGTVFRFFLSPLFLLLMVLGVVTGYGLLEMKRWVWYTLLPTNILMCFLNSIYLNDFSENQNKPLTFAVSTVLILGVLYRLSREIRVPYFFPKIRWWESDPRYKLSVPIQFYPLKDAAAPPLPSEGQIMDLSNGGCFLKVRGAFQENQRIHFRFSAFGAEISGDGVIVWTTRGSVTHPQGLGIKFTFFERQDRQALKLITKRLKKIASFYRKSRYLLNQEEFLQKLHELEADPISGSTSSKKTGTP